MTSLSFPQPQTSDDGINEAALRLVDAVGFDPLTAVRLASAGYDLIGWVPVHDRVGVAT